MIQYAAAYVSALIIMGLADMAWLGIMAKRFYRPTFGDIALTDVNMTPAVIFYLLFPIGLVIFAVAPALKGGTLGSALLYGALFGFFTYATYDLTNYSTLRNWTLSLTIVDVVWGSILAAISAAGSFALASRLS